MVTALRATFRGFAPLSIFKSIFRILLNTSWMDPLTKARAVDKLGLFVSI
jgi:hypothetical protein